MYYRPLSEAQWRQTLAKLRRIRLLAERPAQVSHEATDELDAHPLVREYFGQQLQRDLPEAWRAAHNRLYEHLTRTTPDLPDTLADLTPLFAAVAHGCAAGRQQEAFNEVYVRRILRGDVLFSVKKLGALGADLAALQNLFATPWCEPLTDLTADVQSNVLIAAGYHLRAMGRLPEAIQPTQASLAMNISREDWKSAADSAGNLSELHLALGELPKARTAAQQSVELADRSGNFFTRIVSRGKLADALHQSGLLTEAEAVFHAAEELQKERRPNYPLIYSVQGFRYCDFLLGQDQSQKVLTRAKQMLEWAEQRLNPLDIALGNLALGRSRLSSRDADALAAATPFLHRSVDLLRQAGTLHFLPLGLLARAALYRLTGAYIQAQRDLDEALRITTRGSMRLH